MKLKAIFPAVISFLFLASCEAPKYIYTPSSANLLVPDSKGSLKISANYSNATSATVADNEVAKSAGADLQTAYGVSDHVSVKLDAWFKKEHNSAESDVFGIEHEDIRYKKWGVDLSAGLYTIGEKKEPSFQIYAGAGTGRLIFNSLAEDKAGNQYLYYHQANYVKFFIQPVFVGRISAHNRFSTGLKLNMINYGRVKSGYPNLDQLSFGHITDKPSFFTEFTLHDEFSFKGLKNISFRGQLGFTRLLTKFKYNKQYILQKDKYDYNNLWLSAGVVYSLKLR